MLGRAEYASESGPRQALSRKSVRRLLHSCLLKTGKAEQKHPWNKRLFEGAFLLISSYSHPRNFQVNSSGEIAAVPPKTKMLARCLDLDDLLESLKRCRIYNSRNEVNGERYGPDRHERADIPFRGLKPTINEGNQPTQPAARGQDDTGDANPTRAVFEHLNDDENEADKTHQRCEPN